MVEALDRHLQRDLECADLLECFYELNDLDRVCFSILSKISGPMTIDELASEVGRERSTTYRSVHRLLDVGLLEKEQVNYDHGGYYHVYDVADADTVVDHMQRKLNDWYAEIDYIIGQFRAKYGEESPNVDTPPPII